MARDGSVLVKFLADTLGFRRGTDDMARAVHDAETATATSTGHMSNAYRDAGVKIQSHVDGLHKTVPGKFGEIGGEAGNSLGQNFGAAIGQGGTADIPGAIFGVMGDVAAAMPGAVPVLAIGAAVGIAIVNKITGDSAKIRQAVHDAYVSAVNELNSGPKILTIAEVVGDMTPDDMAALKDAGISVYRYADAVNKASAGNPKPLQEIRDTLDGTAHAAGRAAQNATDYATRVLPDVAQRSAAALGVVDAMTQALALQAQQYRDVARDADLAAQAEWRKNHPAAGGSPFPRGTDQP